MIFARDLSAPEGPVPLPGGRWLLVEMGADRGCVSVLESDGSGRRELARTGRPNGLAVDAAGTIWVAESKTPALLRMALDGSVETAIERTAEGPLLFPNDLCFGPDGALYFTDSGIRSADFSSGGVIRPDYMSVSYAGSVIRFDPKTHAIATIATGIRFANGLAFGPGDTHLYVAETITGDILRYAWDRGTLGKPERFANVVIPEEDGRLRGPDGIAFGANGDLYVTVYGQGDVTVLRPNGTVRRRIRTHGVAPTNVAFGPNGQQRIYVTEVEHGTIEAFDVETHGLPLHAGPSP